MPKVVIRVGGSDCVQQICFKNYRFKAMNSEYRPSTSRVDKDFDLNSLGMGSLNSIEKDGRFVVNLESIKIINIPWVLIKKNFMASR